MSNDLPNASSKFVKHHIAVPTAGVGIPPTWAGRSMNPLTAVPLLPSLDFNAHGRGVWPLEQPGRFPRGPRVSGRQGSIDLWVRLGAVGSARTICYLTDDTASPEVHIAIKVDASNRPLMEITRPNTPLLAATGTLTLTANAANSETVVLNGKTYTFETVLTNVDGHVLIGGSASASIDNLIAAVNLATGSGFLYAAATTIHPTIKVSAGAGDTMVATAKTKGPGGNALTTTETLAAIGSEWAAGTLLGGFGAVTLVAEITPATSALVEDATIHIRATWDSINVVSGTRHASFSVQGTAVPTGEWSTDPTAAWSHVQPTHLVLGQSLADADFNGDILAAQVSNTVTS